MMTLRQLASTTTDNMIIVAPTGRKELVYHVDCDADPDRDGYFREFNDLPIEVQDAEVERLSVTTARELRIYLYKA